MARWQQHARLVIALVAIAVAVVVVRQLRPRVAHQSQKPSVRTDPKSIAEVTGGRLERITFSHPDVSVTFKKQMIYGNGSKLLGVQIVTDERGGTRKFSVTGDEGQVAENEAVLTLDGNVQVTASDGLTVHTDHATFDDHDGLVRAPGPVQFSRGRMKGSGV